MWAFNSITFVVILLYCHPGHANEDSYFKLSEAQQIAMVSSDELLPPVDLSQRIEKDLKAIRSQFPDIGCIVHRSKWRPGKLIFEHVNMHTLEAINQSIYGPIEVKNIYFDKLYEMRFTKPYNPAKLAKLLQREFHFKGASPGVWSGAITEIKVVRVSGVITYVFSKGFGDCVLACLNTRDITFKVDYKQTVVLVKDTGDDSGPPCASKDYQNHPI